MSKKILFILLIVLPLRVYAQGRSFELGVMLGNPTGISAKYWTGRYFAVDAALGYNIRQQNHLLLSADLLAHPWSFGVEEDELKLFFGLGGDLGFMSDLGVSARIPVGAAHHFSSFPLVMFAEIIPTVRIAGPDRPVWISAYLGVRWHFQS